MIRNHHNQIPHLTKDIIRESGKNTRKHHIQESQEVSPFQAGDQKGARNRQDSMIENHKTQKGSIKEGLDGGSGIHYSLKI